jgi:hypothetical protein
MNILEERDFINSNQTSYVLHEDIATFKLYNLEHKWVGFQQYNPNGNKKLRRDPRDGRYYTITSEFGVWGLESIYDFDDSNFIVVCEGVFKACRFHDHKIPAIATLCNNLPKWFSKQLIEKYNDKMVVPDCDNAGMKLIKHGHIYIIPSKHIDDMSREEFDDFVLDLRERMKV